MGLFIYLTPFEQSDVFARSVSDEAISRDATAN